MLRQINLQAALEVFQKFSGVKLDSNRFFPADYPYLFFFDIILRPKQEAFFDEPRLHRVKCLKCSAAEKLTCNSLRSISIYSCGNLFQAMRQRRQLIREV